MSIKTTKSHQQFIYSLGIQVVSILSPFALLPIILRAIGPEAYGSYTLAVALSGMLTGIFVTGFSNLNSREYVKSKAELTDRNQNPPMSRFFLFQVIGGVFASVINIAVALVIGTGEQLTLFLITAAGTILSCFNVDWFFYAVGDVKPLFLRVLVIRSSIILLASLFVRTSDDLILYSVLSQAMLAASNLSSFSYAISKVQIVVKFPRRIDFVNARYFFYSNLVGSIQQYSDQLIVGFVFGKTDLAYLSICRQILGAANGLSVAICRVLLPKSVLASRNKKVFLKHIKLLGLKFIIVILFLSVLMILFTLPIMQLISGTRFSFTYHMFILTALCFFVTSIAVFIDTQINIACSNEIITLESNIVVATIVILGLGLITVYPFLGYISALVVLLLAESGGVLRMLYLNYKLGTLK